MNGDLQEDNAPDRNVLFGITAWQLGLVDRDALMAAMYEWMIDRGRALPDVLESAGNMRPEDRRRVEEMVRLQTCSRAGDAARTLADLESVAEVSEQLKQIARGAGGEPGRSPAVDRKAPTISPHAETLAGPHMSDVVPADATAGAKAVPGLPGGNDRFEVLRSHARGGLGEVLVARDRQLNREVALKQILPKHAANETSRIRFLREAEVTGALEHPGVVPVYGLGTRPDGRPYYAMRFIRGESLEEAIRRFHEQQPQRTDGQRALELRNLLSRFVALCNTIEYAHSRGILHRDIKPDNIMLGPYGETLVVDWGLARPVAAAAEFDSVEVETEGTAEESFSSAQTISRPTQMGTVVGTPQFMSPEQAAGRLDLMSPASDIYSLGATLYYLLTDQPAFTSLKVREVLVDVAEGRFLKPRQVERNISRTLEAICLKAMALAPDARYGSARALADDLEHWMADEPVSALAETELERAARWMRRHKTWTQAVAAAMVLVAVTAGIAYVREAALHQTVQDSLGHEREARGEADVARKAADAGAELAGEQRKLAEAHARRAEEQSRLALATLKSVLFDVQAKLRNVPASRTVRLSMLNSVIEGLKKVARNLETAAETDRSLVRAHLDLGDIFLEVGVADGTGGTQEARRQFERAAEVAEQLHKAAPASPIATADLADVYQRLGDVDLQAGNLTRGADWYGRSLELRERVSETEPGNIEFRRALAGSVQRLGIAHERLNDATEAKAAYARFSALSEQLAKDFPDDLEIRRDLSVSFERMGDVTLAEGELAGADRLFRRSLEVRQQLTDASPGNAQARRDLSVTLDRLGDVALRRSDLPGAEEFYRRSLDLRTALFAEDAANIQTQRDLSVSYALLGDVAERRKDAAGAEGFYGKYHELAVRLAAEDPANTQLQRDLATSYERLGYARLQAGDVGAARDAYLKRFEIIKTLAAADTANPRLRNDLATSYAMLGDLHLQSGDVVAAADYLDQYVTFARTRVMDTPEDDDATRRLVDALVRSADAYLELGRLRPARTLLDEGLMIIEKATASNGPVRRELSVLAATACGIRGQVELDDRDAKAAVPWIRRGIDGMRTLEKQTAGGDEYVAGWIREQEGLLKVCDQAERVQVAAESPAANDQVPAELLEFRAAFLARSGKVAEAEQAADLLASRHSTSAAAQFAAGRRWATIAAGTVGDDKERLRRESRAVELLTKAADAGFFRLPSAVARLRQGDDFQLLQTRDDYRALLERVKRALPNDAAKAVGDF